MVVLVVVVLVVVLAVFVMLGAVGLEHVDDILSWLYSHSGDLLRGFALSECCLDLLGDAAVLDEPVDVRDAFSLEERLEVFGELGGVVNQVFVVAVVVIVVVVVVVVVVFGALHRGAVHRVHRGNLHGGAGHRVPSW